MTGLLIAIFLGWGGGYRFYKKQPVLGVIYLLTAGIFGIGWLIDVILALIDFLKSMSQQSQVVYQQPTPLPRAPFPQVPDPEPEPEPDQEIFFVHYSKETVKNISQLKKKFVVVDTETSGLNSNYDRILSIGAIVYEDGNPVKDFYTLINQPISIPSEVTEINGITNDMIKDAPSERDVMADFRDFCGDAIQGKTLFIAYNSSFDFRFIKKAMERYGFSGNVRHFDVLPYARKKIAELKNYKQVTVAKHLGIDTSRAHNSMGDCIMCATIFLKLVNREN